MTLYRRSYFWWILSFLFTVSIAYYQRTTGPTYPVRGKANIGGKEVRFRLPTSNDSDKPAWVTLKGDVKDLNGHVEFEKYKSDETRQTADFKIIDGNLVAELPPQPPAGKLMYSVILEDKGQTIILTEKPVVIRFKGSVPAFVLIPHVILMFLAMLFSTRTGIEALLKRDKTRMYTLITMILLLLGGMILGPVVQKYAFGAFWTGWPFGHDLTDNKTLVAFLAWVIAYLRLRKSHNRRAWAVAAAIILLMVYLIPHSMFGSELDYSTGEIGTGK